MTPDWSFYPGSDLLIHADLWNAVNAAAGGLPFLETTFLEPLTRHFPEDSLRLALCGDPGAPVAATLLRRDGTGRWSTFQPSQLPLGAWVVARGHDGLALGQRLLKQLPGVALSLGLTQLDPRFAPRPTDDACVQTLDYIDTAWVDAVGSYEAYWDSRGKNLRSNLRKQRNKLDADGVVMRFDSLTDPAEVPAAIAEYGRLESAGWKGESGTAVHPDNAQGQFYTEMMRAFCAQGRGRLWRLCLDDRVVAMDLCIEGGDCLVVLKTTFDPAHRQISPAFLLKQEAFREVFEAGQPARIEFYGKLMEWHTRWTDQSRRLYHANVYRWGWVPKLRERLRRARPSAATSTALVEEGVGSRADG